MLATLASVGMARMVGFLLDTTGGSYAVPFGIASCSYLVALGVLHALLPRLEPMQLDA
jgi:ACS family hexuronate transporter-like MFS transporter